MSAEPKPKRTILVIDDSRPTLELLQELFADRGFHVRAAESVADARIILNKCPEEIDLILSDISMPRETGFDLLRWLKPQTIEIASIPVILTTTQVPEPENRILGLSLGAVDYVVRPIDLEELVLRVENAMDHHSEVENLRHSLETQENLAVLGQALAATNHEIKNMVAIIAMSASVLEGAIDRSGLTLPPHAAKALRSINETSKILGEISRSSGSLVAQEKPTVLTTDISALAVDVLNVLGPRLKGILLEQKIPENTYAAGKRIAIMQILINFVLNAREAIEDLNPAMGGRLSLYIEQSADRISIKVSDNGIGLKKPGQIETFTAFNSTKTMKGGQGLGLWLCQKLAQGMNGNISLSSEGPGLGAIATLNLTKADMPSALVEEIDISKYLD